MTSTSTLLRKGDGKKFKVTYLSHWSDIESEDGEVDSIKWIGADIYVSNSRGFTYYLEAQE